MCVLFNIEDYEVFELCTNNECGAALLLRPSPASIYARGMAACHAHLF